jgi:hypothetical protein
VTTKATTRVKTFVHYLIAAPTFLVGVLFVYGATFLGLARDPGIDAEWHFRATWVDWFAERWLYSTTAGRGIVLHPNHLKLTMVIEHEKVHVRQSEDLCAHGLVLGAMLAWVWGELSLGLLLWFLAPAAHLLNYGMAWLRGLDPYMGAEHERSAYAQTDDDHDH